MPGFTNKLKAEMLTAFFKGDGPPASFFLALVTSAIAPGPDTNTLADLTEIATGNGYVAGGLPLPRSAVSFPAVMEDDANDKGTINIKDVVFTASGGPIPASGDGARYAVLTGPGATIGVHKAYLYFDLLADRVISDGQELQVNGMQAEILEAAA